MKAYQKLKKEKSPSIKGVQPTGLAHKKQQARNTIHKKQEVQNKKVAKKEQIQINKSPSTACFTKNPSSFNTGLQTAKLSHPSSTILKNTPKSSVIQHKSPISSPSNAILKNNSRVNIAEQKSPRQVVQAKKFSNPENKNKKIEIGEKSKEQVKKSLANVIKIYYPTKKQCLDISMTESTKDTSKGEKVEKISKKNYKYLEIIGQGGYGKVWKVQNVKSKRYFAMKEMSKALVVMKKSVDNILNEKKILQGLNSPFIGNINCAFNDRDNLYLVMDYLSGSDLRFRIGEMDNFTEGQVKFVIACIITSLQYIHSKGIFHRDLKPENLVFDNQGYLRLTDFGIARKDKSSQKLDSSGTPGYMAPEVLCKQMHSFQVDFYAVGIIAYELMIGKRPYSGNNRNQIRDAILSKQHSIRKPEVPYGWTLESADFINKCINRSASARLGSKKGVRELKFHPWFSGYNWIQLESKIMKSPFKELHYESKIEPSLEIEDEYSQAVMQYKLLQRADSKVDAFSKYYFQLDQK